jgi:hypothetical protein
VNTRTSTTALTTVSLVLAAGEAIASVVIWREAYADSAPLFVLAFALPFLLAAWLCRSGRAVAGALLTGALCVFELVAYPGQERRNSFDWIFQTTFAAVALVGLGLAIAVLATRLSSRSRTAVPTDV